MELALSLHNGTQVHVVCEGRTSHVFELVAIPADENLETLGAALHSALFPPGSLTRTALDSAERLALVLDKDLDVISWECLRDEVGFVALRMPLVQLVPPGCRQPAPDLSSTPLQVLAVPSNPVARDVPPLNIVGEWRRLREGVEKLSHQVRLERVNPPTIDSLRRLALTRPQSVIHFMGHGGQSAEGAVLFFENDAGGLQPISARDFALSVKKRAFLVTLNACVSAAPGKTEFSNLARLLVEKGLPYALGMSTSIPDDAALTFSRALYAELASGVEVEEAVFQARRSLLRDNKRTWLVGVPVLYSSLEAPCTSGFATPPGQPQVNENQPHLEVFALPRAEGTFQGRVDELLSLGAALTGEPRSKLLTIHGAGGQGKTALAREAAERFAHAWPGGVWAVSLENKPNRAIFCFQLAQFLDIPTDNFPQQGDLERVILTHLNQQRALLILDNAETFTEAVRSNDSEAIDLAQFLREGLLGTSTSLLVTSREPLGWPGEQVLPLEGLSQAEGAALFAQSASLRQTDIQLERAESLSARLGGHPLALLLLGLAFNETSISLEQFIAEHETRLLAAENRYKAVDNRHRTLYASIETSVRYLDEAHKALLSGLWIFQAPFMPETAAQVFTPPELPEGKTKAKQEQIVEHLQTLARRGLLVREIETLADGNILLYRTLPTVRLFIQSYLAQALPAESLQARMASAYAELIRSIYRELDRGAWASSLALRCRLDLETCAKWLPEEGRGWIMNRLGWVLQRLGDRGAGSAWMERALEIAQGKDQELELNIINNLAQVYLATGQPNQALALYQQALPIRREVGDRAGEAATLNNMAGVYLVTGVPSQALALYQQALPITREVGDRAGEATTLNNIAEVYRATGNPSQALALYQQALPITREVGDHASEATILNNIALVYSTTGHPGQALALYQQALSITREVGDRAGEAATLHNMASVYCDTGRPVEALKLFQQALSITREVGDRAGEAATLHNMASVYRDTGRPGQAFALYQQALPMLREVGDRAGEAATLNNMAMVYSATGKPVEALKLYQQALPTLREVGDRAGEAGTLNNMAVVYRATGQLGQALELYQQALPLMREVGDRAGEAATLHNMAVVYRATGQPGQALAFYQQALPIRREVGDRAGEAATLHNMAGVYLATGQPGQALAFYQQALPIRREVGNQTGEADTLASLAILLYSDLSRPPEAIQALRLAIEIVQKLGLPQTAAGTTSAQMQATLEMMQSGQPLCGGQNASGLSSDELQTIVDNTIAVLTAVSEQRGEWREVIAVALGQAQAGNMETDAEFFEAILALLNGRQAGLPAANPYAGALREVLRGLEK